ncbi:hypothetical protein PQQ59_37115 [Paraburkholderia aspalathi]|uniref:surface-adhesin E family protein n=1 Tax=Paraburkholderia aspalathi TaxID=1324617 RepID=UPI0038B80CCE
MKGIFVAAIAASTMLTCTVAHADTWGKIIDLNDSVTYVRFPAPTFSVQPIKIWSLQDFKESHLTEGNTWRSRLKLGEYDCANGQTTTKEVIFYEQNMAKGYPVQSMHVDETDAVVPGTLGEAMFKEACKV